MIAPAPYDPFTVNGTGDLVEPERSLHLAKGDDDSALKRSTTATHMLFSCPVSVPVDLSVTIATKGDPRHSQGEMIPMSEL